MKRRRGKDLSHVSHGRVGHEEADQRLLFAELIREVLHGAHLLSHRLVRVLRVLLVLLVLLVLAVAPFAALLALSVLAVLTLTLVSVGGGRGGLRLVIDDAPRAVRELGGAVAGARGQRRVGDGRVGVGGDLSELELQRFELDPHRHHLRVTGVGAKDAWGPMSNF